MNYRIDVKGLDRRCPFSEMECTTSCALLIHARNEAKPRCAFNAIGEAAAEYIDEMYSADSIPAKLEKLITQGINVSVDGEVEVKND